VTSAAGKTDISPSDERTCFRRCANARSPRLAVNAVDDVERELEDLAFVLGDGAVIA